MEIFIGGRSPQVPHGWRGTGGLSPDTIGSARGVHEFARRPAEIFAAGQVAGPGPACPTALRASRRVVSLVRRSTARPLGGRSGLGVVSLIVARITGFTAVGLVHFDPAGRRLGGFNWDGCFRVFDVRP